MKNLYSILFITLIFLSVTVFGGAFLEDFTGYSDGENIILSWKTAAEEDVLEYVIMRGPNRNEMMDVATISPKGSNSEYKYTDENAYKTTESLYVYKLKIVDTRMKESFSKVITVSHSPSGVKRTWGSIKALFR